MKISYLEPSKKNYHVNNLIYYLKKIYIFL